MYGIFKITLVQENAFQIGRHTVYLTLFSVQTYQKNQNKEPNTKSE